MWELDRTNSNAGAPESARHSQHIATWSKASTVGFRSASATHSSHTASAVSSFAEIDPSGPMVDRSPSEAAHRAVKETSLVGGRMSSKE